MKLSRLLAKITPTLDGDVLAELARHEVRFTQGRAWLDRQPPQRMG